MWHTSEGDRILHGAEAALVRAAVLSLVESIKDEHFQEGGYCVQLFDELTWSQRLAVIEHVATHLLTPTEDTPKLTAVNEAAIGAMFEHISLNIDMEIDESPSKLTWRTLVLDACHEAFGIPVNDPATVCELDDGPPIPTSVSSVRRDQWHPSVQMLADRILWDRDYEMVDEFLDEPPEKAALLRQIMGIDENYFSVAAVDLTSDEDVRNTLQRLAKILS